MDIMRIRSEVSDATRTFPLVEAHPTNAGGVFVKAVLQTSVGNTYIAAISFPNYPSQMPRVSISKPELDPRGKNVHRFTDGTICYLHHTMWNPGVHNLTFVLARVAKWLNKYEVWRQSPTGKWPGAEIKH